MDFKVIWSDEAITDLRAICSYIARDNPGAALRMGNALGARRKRPMKYPCRSFIVCGLLAILLAGCSRRARLAEPVAVARACLEMTSSSLTNQINIRPDDQRLPEVIRALRPQRISITAQTATVIFPLHNGLIEYHCSPVAGATNTWQLFGAGPRFNNERRELLRMHRG